MTSIGAHHQSLKQKREKSLTDSFPCLISSREQKLRFQLLYRRRLDGFFGLFAQHDVGETFQVCPQSAFTGVEQIEFDIFWQPGSKDPLIVSTAAAEGSDRKAEEF